MEGHSTVEDQRPRNSYYRVCYVFVAQAASACHWNWTAMGDGQRPTEGDSRLRGTREPDRQATDVCHMTCTDKGPRRKDNCSHTRVRPHVCHIL